MELARQAYALTDKLSLADQAAALHVLVSAEAEAGRVAEARAHADELCELVEQAGGTQLVKALWASAVVRIRQADYHGAQEVLERALQYLDSRDDLMLWMRLRLAAASLYLQITPPLIDRAVDTLTEITPALALIGTELHKQQLLTLQAHLAFEQGRLADARTLCDEISEGELRLAFRDLLRFQALRARLLTLDGDAETGIRMLEELAQQARDALNVELSAEIWRSLARTLAELQGRQSSRSVAAPGTAEAN
jgi:tetratricopeptide (TPR) repeat protein